MSEDTTFVILCVLVTQSYVTVTPWTVSHQAPPSMVFSRQEYWSRLPFPSPEDLPNPGSNPGLPHSSQILYYLSPQVVDLVRFSSLAVAPDCTLSSPTLDVMSGNLGGFMENNVL